MQLELYPLSIEHKIMVSFKQLMFDIYIHVQSDK